MSVKLTCVKINIRRIILLQDLFIIIVVTLSFKTILQSICLFLTTKVGRY